MPKVIDKYKRFVADEKEMSAYNERDTFLYGQAAMLAAMLQYEREAGKKEGIEIGFQKGIEQGEINRAKIIALNLKNMNMNNEDISRITGLTIEEINEL